MNLPFRTLLKPFPPPPQPRWMMCQKRVFRKQLFAYWKAAVYHRRQAGRSGKNFTPHPSSSSWPSPTRESSSSKKSKRDYAARIGPGNANNKHRPLGLLAGGEGLPRGGGIINHILELWTGCVDVVAVRALLTRLGWMDRIASHSLSGDDDEEQVYNNLITPGVPLNDSYMLLATGSWWRTGGLG